MKRGIVGIIILGVLGFLLIVGLSAGIYFYNFHVFKELRVCIGESQDVLIPCEVRQDCLDFMETNGVNFSALDEVPDFMRVKVNEILEKAVYCEETCFVRELRGIDLEGGGIEVLDSCLKDEDEVVMEIRGKEGIEVLKWMKEKGMVGS